MKIKTIIELGLFFRNKLNKWFSKKCRKSKTTLASNKYFFGISGREKIKTFFERIGGMQKCFERSNDDFLPRLSWNRRIRTRKRNSRRILRRCHQIRTTRSILIIYQYLQEETSLWWASKELLRGKLLSDYTGKNEKTKIVDFPFN